MMDLKPPRRRWLAVGLAGCLATSVWAAGPAPSSTPPFGLRDKLPNAVAFTHATVVVSPTQTIEDGTLVVRDGRVVAVGAGLAVPPGVAEIRLDGMRILPGFLDPYTDYGLEAATGGEGQRGGGRRRGRDRAPQYLGDRRGAGAWNDALHAERNAVDGFAPDAKAAEALWKRGVTSAVTIVKDGILRGRGAVVSLGQGLANDEVLLAAGPLYGSFDKGSSEQEYPSSLMGSIALLRQTFLDARWYAAARAAWEKDPAQPAPEVNRDLAALATYHGPLFFETAEDLSLLRAARIGQEMGVPIVHLGSGFEYERLDEVAALDQALVLPLSFPKAPDVSSPEAALDVSLADLRHWERAPSTAAALAGKGVKVAFSGFRLRDDEDFWSNLRRTIRRGLPAATALAALTTVPAELVGVAAQVGTLEPGKRADFLVSDGDLLSQDEAAVVAVVIDGRVAKEWSPLAGHDFRGRYRLALDGKSYDLEIKGSRTQLCGELALGKDRHDLDDVALSADALHFSTDLAARPGGDRKDGKRERGPAQSLTFTLVAIGDGVEGWAALPDGKRKVVRVEPQAGAVSAASCDRWGRQRGGAGEDGAQLVSRHSVPNEAFGFEVPPQPATVLVRNATIWTVGPEGTLTGADLLVADGKIQAIGRGLAVPPGARVIDAAGKHVSPGMIDEHSHLAISQGVNEGSHAVTAEVRIGDVLDPDDVGIYRALAGGTTAAQLLHGSANPIGGQAQIVKLRWGASAEAMKLAGAPPTIKFALGENVKQSNWGEQATIRYPQTRMGVETIMKDAFLAARDNQAAWQHYEALPAAERERTVPPRRDLTLEALNEILDGKRFVHCHSYVQSEMLMLMRLAEELGFTVQTFTHVLEGYKVAPEMAKHGAGASSFSDWWAYKFEVYDAIPYNTCLLHDRGIVTSINSDSEELIRRLNQEAAKSVLYCGMEPTEAIKLATINPAKQLKVDDRIGSLEVGKDADFVIWNGNPLSMLSRVEETWVDGVQLFSRQRDAELRQAATEEKRALIAKVQSTGGGKGWGDRSFRKREKDWDCEDVEDVWHEQH